MKSDFYWSNASEWYRRLVLPYASPIFSRKTRIFIGIVGIGILSLNLYAPAEPNILERLLASLIIIIALVPTFLWLSGREHGIPFLTFFGAIYIFYYALPVFLLEKYSRAYYIPFTIPHIFIQQALLYALIGLGALYLGYYNPIHVRLAKILPKISFNWNPISHVRYVGLFLGVMGVLTFYIKMIFAIPLSLKQVIDFLGDLSLISVVLLFILQFKGRLKFIEKLFLWGLLIPTRILLALGTGAIAHILEVILILLMTHIFIKHNIPWKILVIVILLFFFLRATQEPFRALAWTTEAGDLSPETKSILYLKTLISTLRGDTMAYKRVYEIGVSRLSHLMTFAEVIELTPNYVPYWMGETYYPLLFKIIPRLFYPDKPLEVTGQAFGHRYGFLHPQDYVTSYNLPQLIEFYSNFGIFGVLIGMFFLGIVYKSIQHIFFHKRMGLGAIAALIYIMSKCLLIESGLSMVMGGVFWGLVFFGLLNMLIKLSMPFKSIKSV